MFTLPAAAQEAPEGEAGVADITVTAQRRSEKLQDVPIAVSAFTADELAARQITRALDIVTYVPNMIGHSNTAIATANSYALRGLGNTESIATFDLPVGTYIDDVYVSRQGANNFSFFDVERVEVLRGPQGTLFGRNTTGGAINVVMRKPQTQYGGFAEIGYGRFQRMHARASADLPVLDQRLLTKLSAFYTGAQGYVFNQTTGQRLNGDESVGVRGAVRVLAGDVTWDGVADYVRASGSGLPHFYRPGDKRRINFTRLRDDVPLGEVRGAGNPAIPIVSPELRDNRLENVARSWSLISNFEIALGAATLNVITGYRHLTQEYVSDSADSLTTTSVVYRDHDFVSATPGTTTVLANDSYHKQFTQEVKLTGEAAAGLLSYVAGAYYLKEDNQTIFANVNVPRTGNATVVQDRTVWNATRAFAGYAQVDVHPVPLLTLTAGIRYTDEHKDVAFAPNANALPRAAASNTPFTTADVVALGIPVEQRARVWTPRFAIDFKPTPDLMLFASATKGFKSGGWNARASTRGQAIPFTRETVWSFESGIRSEWFDRKLRANLTGFYFTATDFQLPAAYEDPVTNLVTYQTRNFADLRNYGLEGDITLAPVAGLNLYWSFGLQHARYRNLGQPVLDQLARCRTGPAANNCNAGIVTPAGTIATPVRAPDFSSTLGANYRLPLGQDWSITPNIAWQHLSGSWVSTSGDPRGYQNPHSLFNAGITLRDQASGLAVAAECTNCLDKVYKTAFLIYPYLNEPARWLLRVRKDF